MDRITAAHQWILNHWNDVANVQAIYHVNLVTLIFGSICAYFAYILIYGFFFCPARHIPGPFLTRFGKWHYYALFLRGSISADIHELHKKYGNDIYYYTHNTNVKVPSFDSVLI